MTMDNYQIGFEICLLDEVYITLKLGYFSIYAVLKVLTVPYLSKVEGKYNKNAFLSFLQCKTNVEELLFSFSYFSETA